MITKIMSVELLRANMMYFVSFVLLYWMYILFRRRLHHRDAEGKYLMCHKGNKPTNINRNPPISTKLSNKKPFNIGNSFNMLLHSCYSRRISNMSKKK